MASAVEDVDLISLRPGQCLIIADERLFETRTSGTHVQLGMDNLYLRIQRLDKSREPELMAFSGVSVWLTNMTLQGDGPGGAARALWAYRNAMVRISGASPLLPGFHPTL